MQFLTLTAVGFFAALSAAQNAFTYPTTGDVLAAGSTSTLAWDATTNGTVSLRLQWGSETTSTDGVVIATDIDNSGSYDWDVPADIPVEADYFIYIVDDDDADITNYSARFAITGATGSTTTTTSASVASSTTSVASTSTAASNTTTTAATTTTSASASSSSAASSTTLVTSSSSAAASSSTAAVATTTTAKSSTAAVSSSTASATSVADSGVGAVKAPSMMLGVFGLVAYALL